MPIPPRPSSEHDLEARNSRKDVRHRTLGRGRPRTVPARAQIEGFRIPAANDPGPSSEFGEYRVDDPLMTWKPSSILRRPGRVTACGSGSRARAPGGVEAARRRPRAVAPPRNSSISGRSPARQAASNPSHATSKSCSIRIVSSRSSRPAGAFKPISTFREVCNRLRSAILRHRAGTPNIEPSSPLFLDLSTKRATRPFGHSAP